VIEITDASDLKHNITLKVTSEIKTQMVHFKQRKMVRQSLDAIYGFCIQKQVEEELAGENRVKLHSRNKKRMQNRVITVGDIKLSADLSFLSTQANVVSAEPIKDYVDRNFKKIFGNDGFK
jgi:hypothetical protein